MTARARLAEANAAFAAGRDRIRSHYANALGAMAAYVQRVDQEDRTTAARIKELVKAGHAESYAEWGSSAWEHWSPEHHVPDEVRLAGIDDGDLADLPATVPLFRRRPIVLITQDLRASNHAHTALRNTALRIAAAAGPKVMLHLIDPFQMGHGFLNERDLPNAATLSTDAMANLRAARETAQADSLSGSEARRHVVLAMDYPRGFNHQDISVLNSLPQLPNTQLIIHHDFLAAESGSMDLDLRDVIAVEIGSRGVAEGCWGRLRAVMDPAAPEHLAQHIHDSLTSSLPGTNTVWAELNSTDPTQWWAQSARHQAVARVGIDRRGTPIELTFGVNSDEMANSHLAIGGATRSGKSVLLHALITSLATRYSPDELQLLLIDGRNGAEMQAYRNLPHAQAVAVYTPPDMAAGVILDIHKELARRNGQLVRHSVQSISALPDHARIPRMVVVIDEYHVYLEDLTNPVGKALLDVTKRGAAAGIHLVLASQSFHGAGAGYRGTFYDNIQTRVALPFPETSIDLLTEFSREAKDLIRRHCQKAGDVVVHSGSTGTPDIAGRIGFIARQEIDDVVTALAARDPHRPMVLDGNEPPSAAENPALKALARVPRNSVADEWASRPEAEGGLGVANWPSQDFPAAFVVGRSMTIHGSAFAVLKRTARQNIAVICDDAEILTGVLQAGLASFAASFLPSGCRIWVLSQIRGRTNASWAGAITDRLACLVSRWGHEVRVATDPVALVQEAVAELERRRAAAADEQAEQDSLMIVAAGLESLAPFHSVDGRYERELSEATQDVARLATEGPIHGIHVVLGMSSRDAWEQVWPIRKMELFNHRFYGQLSGLDSQRIFGDMHANDVEPGGVIQGPRRMGYTDVVAGSSVTFLPYASGTDLDQALASIVRS